MAFPWRLLLLMLAGVAAGGCAAYPIALSLPQTAAGAAGTYAAGWVLGLAGAVCGGLLALRLDRRH